MGFRYQLRFADGADAGEAEYSFTPRVGDKVVYGSRRLRVTAVIPVELAGEFVDGAVCGVLEVEPVAGHTPWNEIEHKASPEQLADARAALDEPEAV